VNDMTYLNAVDSTCRTISEAPGPDVEPVHLGLELVLHGWSTFTAGVTGPTAWDLLGVAVLEVAALCHCRDPIVIVLDTRAREAERAWLATTRLLAAIADHVDEHFFDELVPGVPRWEWRRAAVVLRSALGSVS
jgi:hypothetical protein